MIRILSALLLAAVLAPETGAAAGPATAFDFAFTAIDGKPLALAGYKGKTVLVKNTASQCGFTPQYKGLQALWERYRARPFILLGVPSNDFGGQEPGSNAEIKTFCETTFGIDFPMTAKTAVIGADAHPLYRWAAESFGEAAVPRWNFHKILIGPDGTVTAAFPTRTAPDDPALTAAIDAALAAGQ